MSRQGWVEAIRVAKGAGASLSNSSSATTLLTGDKITIPAAWLEVGKAMRITLTGRLSNIVTTPGTLTLDVRLGSVVAFNAGAIQLSTTAHTTLPFWAEILVTARAEGQSTNANLIGLMRMISQCIVAASGADSVATHGAVVAPNVTPAVGTGYDSTAAQTLDIFATFSVANAANLIQLEQYVIELLN